MPVRGGLLVVGGGGGATAVKGERAMAKSSGEPVAIGAAFPPFWAGTNSGGYTCARTCAGRENLGHMGALQVAW